MRSGTPYTVPFPSSHCTHDGHRIIDKVYLIAEESEPLAWKVATTPSREQYANE